MAASKPVLDPEEPQKEEGTTSGGDDSKLAIWEKSVLQNETAGAEQAAKVSERESETPVQAIPTSRPVVEPDSATRTAFPWREAPPKSDGTLFPAGRETSATSTKPEAAVGVDNTKIGLVGGREVGKTFFFYGIIYRTLQKIRSGAVARYLQSSELRIHNTPGDDPSIHDPDEVVNSYRRWTRFLPTEAAGRWYRLALEFRTGLIGTKVSRLNLEFLEGSGEFLFARALDASTEETWRTAVGNAGIMVFCLPIWAAFPGKLNAKEREKREMYLKDFTKVLSNYQKTRVPGLKIRTILALTMADDDIRCSLSDLISKWIKPYMNRPEDCLKQLRSKSGIPRYLAMATRVSDYLHQKFLEIHDNPLVGRIPETLNFGRGLPWIIPISAVEGRMLDRAEEIRQSGSDTDALPEDFAAPVPIHVELPLLAALCENHNALM